MNLLELETDHIIDELHMLGFTDTENLTYEELKQKLAVLRALEIDVSSSSNRYF